MAHEVPITKKFFFAVPSTIHHPPVSPKIPQTSFFHRKKKDNWSMRVMTSLASLSDGHSLVICPSLALLLLGKRAIWGRPSVIFWDSCLSWRGLSQTFFLDPILRSFGLFFYSLCIIIRPLSHRLSKLLLSYLDEPCIKQCSGDDGNDDPYFPCLFIFLLRPFHVR